MVYGGIMGTKSLVRSTLCVALSIFAFAIVNQELQKSVPIAMQAIGSPSIGKASAPIEIVLIEDFQCRNCRTFSRKIIPKIQSEYIQSGQVRFILIPVSFLVGSQAIANATLEVYKQNSERFFPYLKEILNHEGEVRPSDLVALARKVGGIDLAKLHTCIQQGWHNQELANNLNWAQGVMGSRFRTPALYINGNPGSTFSFEAIQYQIDQILGKK